MQTTETPVSPLARTEGTSSFSRKILRIDWNRHFPYSLRQPGCVVELSHFESCSQFIEKNHSRVYEQNLWGTSFPNEKIGDSKLRYYQEVGDFFQFQVRGECVGVFIGTVTDWSSYYLRYCAILPEHQGQGFFQEMVKHLLATLELYGVQRVEGDVSPSNLVNIHIFNKLQFNVTGLRLTDRWGAMIHFCKFLNRSPENLFLDQFCSGTRPQLKRWDS